jgi:hypothetical protein
MSESRRKFLARTAAGVLAASAAGRAAARTQNCLLYNLTLPTKLEV